jgi:sulfotransferase family protein
LRLLFIGGPPRSGTSALTDYLNQHPEVLICMERYKWVPPHEVRPKLFTFKRVLDYKLNSRGDRPETNTPWERHVELLASKDPERLTWMGDKTPAYVEHLYRLSENNPGASFILTYRPLEEVAESFEARAKDSEAPWLLGGFETGVEQWNAAMKFTCNFVKSALNLNVLILSYHEFFYDNQAVVPLLSRFLDIEIDQSMQEAWTRMSHAFETRRRTKEPLSEEKRAYIEARKDEAAERWVLNRIRKQRRELNLYLPKAARALNAERRKSAVIISGERRKSRRLKREVEELRERNQNLQ